MTPPSILEFESVTVAGGHPYDTGLYQVSFAIRAGELVLVRLGNDQARVPVADAASGIIRPDEGSVRSLGQDWNELPSRRADVARGQIGRVFAGTGWVSDLTVEENITLAQRHHTNRPDADIRSEAAALAKRFTLPGLPQGYASAVRRQDLQRAACVRAFLGQPKLLILEEPTAGVYPQIMTPLMASLREARARGAAALWLTADQNVWNDRGIPATLRCTMSGSQLRVNTGGK